MLKIINRYRYILIFVGILMLYYFPFVRFRSAAYFTIHDNLDGFFVLLKHIANPNYFFADSNFIVPEIMNGIPRWMLGSYLNLTAFLFYLFPPAWAYILNLYIVKLIAFGSMYIFLKKGFNFTKQYSEFSICLTALVFALVPFYSLYGIAIAGLPLFFLALIYTWRSENTLIASLVLFVYSFLCYAPVIVPYMLMIYGCLILYLLWTKRFKWVSILPFLALLLSFFIVEHQLLFNSFFNKSITLHRTEFVPNEVIPGDFNVLHFQSYIDILMNGTYHSGYLPAYLIIAFVVSISLFTKFRKSFYQNQVYLFLFLAIGLILISYLSVYVRIYLGDFFPLLKGFTLERFFFFTIPIWILILGILIQNLNKIIAIVLISSFLLLTISKDEETIVNWQQMAGKYKNTNMKAFYAEKLFKEIDLYINKPKNSYRVVSIAMYPSSALYNGFYCLDAYVNAYPITYKKEFREVISKELDKSEIMQRYYDNWGSRCYIFSSELGKKYEFSRKSSETIKNLEINTHKLKEMGCEYIFSSLPIQNYSNLNLIFLKDFEDSEGKWKIYLYQIK